MSQEIKYPGWVQPGQLIRGDVKFVKNGEKWNKMYYTGAGWIPEKRANIQLKQLSQKRGKHVSDQELFRKSGLF